MLASYLAYKNDMTEMLLGWGIIIPELVSGVSSLLSFLKANEKYELDCCGIRRSSVPISIGLVRPSLSCQEACRQFRVMEYFLWDLTMGIISRTINLHTLRVLHLSKSTNSRCIKKDYAKLKETAVPLRFLDWNKDYLKRTGRVVFIFPEVPVESNLPLLYACAMRTYKVFVFNCFIII